MSFAAFKEALSSLSFTSAEEAVSSDHKPVIAEYNLATRGGLRGIMVSEQWDDALAITIPHPLVVVAQAYSTNFISHSFPRYTTSTSYRIKNLRVSASASASAISNKQLA
jgi:hypothetical protein